ncbi:hypothetical protein P170DRAFT_429806 [Aspergillus steynii IBT 23096]|uniref:Uncharacterized protein n=1 Tax=Aspergillus steynii IBT 23096 TaxID=1392250 RepID=A0A2I2FWT4_9EURO|nr:uncharacterized protein P170DRAFT_429806 [Aspergillus steynii IBT 23096]PLB45103.1 hypothetical protein P170DRAFT_429806 [Aspergillus steynii IBT 23096]
MDSIGHIASCYLAVHIWIIFGLILAKAIDKYLPRPPPQQQQQQQPEDEIDPSELEPNNHLVSKALDFAMHTKVWPFWTELSGLELSPLLDAQNKILLEEGEKAISDEYGIPVEAVNEVRATRCLTDPDGPLVQDYLRRFDSFKWEVIARSLPAIAAMVSTPGQSQLKHMKPFPQERKRTEIWNKLCNRSTAPILRNIAKLQYTPTDNHHDYVRRCRGLVAELRKLKEVADWVEFKIFMAPLAKEAVLEPFIAHISRVYLKISLIEVYAKFVIYEDTRKGRVNYAIETNA